MSKSKLTLLSLLLVAGVLTGCRQDMHDNPRLEAYEDGANRQYPEGVVARGALATNPAGPAPAMGSQQQVQTVTAAGAAAPAHGAAPAEGVTPATLVIPKGEDAFPFKVTQELLDRGEERFNINCSHCHGKLGKGDGMIVLRGFKRPPSYHEDRLRQAPASYLYDVMTNGFGAMPSYADQVTVEDRWKIAAYIRVLQLSQRADFNSLPADDKAKVQAAAQQPNAGAKSGEHAK
jgi:mono/diheme cytochrome c family protein